jgi:hypothetical protein
MAEVTSWYLITLASLQNLWYGIIAFLPRFVGALLIFFVGWIFAVVLGGLVAELLRRVKFNQLFERGGWKEVLEKAEIDTDAAAFIGAIVKWVFALVFLSAAVEVLGFVQFTQLMQGILGYLPNVLIAVLLFTVAVVVADIVEKLVKAGVGGVRIGYARVAGSIAKWAIWVFAILAILRQLLIAPQMIDVVFGALVYGTVAFLVISFGLAFGLGGKEVAAEILQDLKRRLRKD